MDALELAVARTLGNRNGRGSSLIVCGIAASIAVHQGCLAGIGQRHELNGGVAADLAAVGHDGQGLQTTALADVCVSLLHVVVSLLQTLLGGIEGIAVLHDELATAHKAEAGAHLVAELILDLIQVNRELLVAAQLVLDKVGHRLLVRGPEYELALVAIGDAHELGAIHVVATGVAPHIGIDHDGHEQLLGAGLVHLVAHDVLDLAQGAPRERQIAV